uniref:Uncharacterized protein n=1 Tax=Magallana gigas TaxID=29159 RepID=A0A8W8JKL3_MAGGI
MTNPQLNPDEKAELQKRLAARQEKLLSMFHQMSIQFADPHDTPGRMEEMGVITPRVFLLESGTKTSGEAAEEEYEAVLPQCGGGGAQLHVSSLVCEG